MTNTVQWRVLPNKANQAMEQAGADAARDYLERTGSNSLFAIYEAMALAAPTPPHVEDDEVCASLPKPVDDSELPVVGEAVYDTWDMAQQWNGCREAFLPVVMRLKAERDILNALLAIAYGDIEHASRSLGQCVSCGECPEDDDIITHDPSCAFCAIEMALCAKSKPNALAQIDERAEFEAFALGKGWLPHQIKQRPDGNYEDWGVNPEWQAWKARAALEKKS
ncbi:hypothetical protein [Pseudomonas juntendi]|uniref:hypothetical protein n=1 Tax=Pseudomonas juntendi TaxID=2666183 RepID=UPI00244D438F|nr:hypothetical protein [Pseudomonas juntendi]MDG9889693.1 hypothetical protein [Pseudomonas juntendi]MDH0044872.1 hypothetical protein [Pseudomonas juntendi]